MQLNDAIIREQGLAFAVLVVKRHILDSRSQVPETADGFRGTFSDMPIVLMGQDARGRATYFGRHDVVNFHSNVSPGCLPWRRFTLN